MEGPRCVLPWPSIDRKVLAILQKKEGGNGGKERKYGQYLGQQKMMLHKKVRGRPAGRVLVFRVRSTLIKDE